MGISFTGAGGAAVVVTDDGVTVLDPAETINFRGLPTTDVGGGQVDVEAAIEVQDSGATIDSEAQFINFASNVSVSASGDGIDVDASGGGGGGSTTTNFRYPRI